MLKLNGLTLGSFLNHLFYLFKKSDLNQGLKNADNFFLNDL